MNSRNFFAELQRRDVYKVAVGETWRLDRHCRMQ
jgi:hypothetical protein